MTPTLNLQCAKDFGVVPDCGCPYEHWHLGGYCLDLHFEPEGHCHAILNAAEDETETKFNGMTSLDQARPLALAWATEIIGGMAG